MELNKKTANNNYINERKKKKSENLISVSEKPEYTDLFENDYFNEENAKNYTITDLNYFNFLKSEIFVESFKSCKTENITTERTQRINDYIKKRNNGFKEFVNENKAKNRYIYYNTLYLNSNRFSGKKYEKLINGCKELIEKYLGFKTKELSDYICTIEGEFEEIDKQKKSNKSLINMKNKIKKQYYIHIQRNKPGIRKTVNNQNLIDLTVEEENYSFRNNVKHNNFNLTYDAEKNIYEYYTLIQPFETIVNHYPDLISLLIFTDVNIYELKPSHEIFGRVNKLGGKIAIISLNNELDSETIITCLHETIHTFGISHCNVWDCIMNSKNDIDGYSSIDICPIDLIKLKLYNWNIDFLQRYKSLREVYLKLGWDNDVRDCEEKIELMEIFFNENR